MPLLTVTKCQATGNDFILIDERASDSAPPGEHGAQPPKARAGAATHATRTGRSSAEHDYGRLAALLCDRRFGIGADGLLVLLAPRAASDAADVRMRVFNADGSEAETCGNGLRCVALHVRGNRRASDTPLRIETRCGVVSAGIVERAGETQVRVDMGAPSLGRAGKMMRADGREAAGETLMTPKGAFRVSSVSMGNPHCVVFLGDDIARADLAAIAEAIDAAAVFPSGVNVEIVNAAPGFIEARVHERGVGETWACGSGACAAAVAAIMEGKAVSPVPVVMRGGTVVVEWQGPGTSAFLTGSARLTFTAIVDPAELRPQQRLSPAVRP